MPLLDHFQSSWAAEWPWDGIHATWATKIAEQLNDDFLPPDFHAIPQSHVGTPFEIDVEIGRAHV